MEIGRRIYFDKATGTVILETGERQDAVITTTIEHDIAAFKALSERNRDTFDVIQLEYGQYYQDFIESRMNFRVNPETKTLEFSYPDPATPEAPKVFGPPLTEQVKTLEAAIMELSVLVAGGAGGV